MRRDAFDALRYGCTGLMGIHWRTRILAPNVSALAKAAWDQSGWREAAAEETEASRFLPVADFYADWARRSSGRKRPSRSRRFSPAWTATCLARPIGLRAREASGPTRVHGAKCRRSTPSSMSWRRLRAKISAPGNLERFDYWLNQFRCLRAIAKAACDWARFNAAMARAKKEKDPQAQRQLAKELALPARKDLVRRLRRTAPPFAFRRLQFRRTGQRLQLAATNAAGGADRARPGVGQAAGRRPARRRRAIEPNTWARRGCSCPWSARGFVAGEPLRLTVVVLGGTPENAALRWRPLGGGEFAAVPLEHVARGVYAVTFARRGVRSPISSITSKRRSPASRSCFRRRPRR